ncbi:hypothetical protein PIB30_053199 [Stylosanthes scabra]|uniref:RING-type E3 ubiquitin transferase n=1 Tax=Stylosanthes scabra TaxID=79078 RepID=A0ABU6YHP3_9FABA|nr:hypothetical protein [Stylosanthes scabra]
MKTSSIFCSLFILNFLLSVPLSLAQNQNDSSDANNNYNTQFSPSLAIIVVILVAALFLMGFFSIYIRHCADSPSGTALPITAGGGRSRRAARGLDPAVIETFPILEYSEVKIHKIGKEILECAVCLCEFEDTETLRLIPKCDHVFHPECIDEWLSSHTTCPVCRANLVPQPGESVHAVPLVATADLEAQTDAAVDAAAPEEEAAVASSEPEVISIPKSLTLNRNRTTRASRSSRRRNFPRSHSTGHSVVQPGENTDRFTLRLPVAVRREIINRELQRSNSLLVLPREGSSRQGSSRGRTLRRLDRSFKSDRWVLTMAPPFLVRGTSVRSPKVVDSTGGEGTSSSTAPILPPSAVDSARPPV